MPWWLDFIILLFMTSRKRITIIGAATTSTTALCSSRLLPGKWLSQMSMQRVSLTYHYFQKTLKFVRYSQILDYSIFFEKREMLCFSNFFYATFHFHKLCLMIWLQNLNNPFWVWYLTGIIKLIHVLFYDIFVHYFGMISQ